MTNSCIAPDPSFKPPNPVPTCVDDTDPRLLHQFQSAPLNILIEPHDSRGSKL
ncbi:uncharacterized protein CCOS01_00453 [Colletotrichum costaricense]|uniref:Uncharacterized protein n=1 Tax=Colletotrichum costaricense TaxID=1209916 RepID=A0AAI9Z928_9PEZI|nr:uncharacterized protein CCOS01_00453 [Colletotrichum costaricense]KAK1539139.1 hypothetical protein CCOS01_00453 [Colletotrichum costaricense]